MAKLSNRKDGRYLITFASGPGGSLSLSKSRYSRKQAEAIKRRIEDLLAGDRILGDATRKWIDSIDDDLRKRLIEKRLLSDAWASLTPDANSATRRYELGGFVEDYIAKRDDLAKGTVDHLNRVKDDLIDYFTSGRLLSTITTADAFEFMRHLRRPKGNGGKGLAKNTTAKRCQRAKHFFDAAVSVK